jgi:hypothetical protein
MRRIRSAATFSPSATAAKTVARLLGQSEVGTGVHRPKGMSADDSVKDASQVVLPEIGVRHPDDPKTGISKLVQQIEQWAVRPQMCDLDVDLRLAEQMGRVVVSAERLCHGHAYGRQRGLTPGALDRHRSVGAALQRPAKPGEYVGVHTEQRTDPPAHLSQALGS